MKNKANSSLKKEALRKLIHLSSLWMPILIWHLNRTESIIIFIFVFLFILALEQLRIKTKLFKDLYYKLFYNILRDHEKNNIKNHFSGAFYVVTAALIAVMLFSKKIAVTSLCIMLVSDSAAALIGKKYGKTKITAHKTVAGSVAFFLSGIIVIFVIYLLTNQNNYYILISSISLIIATIIELFSKSLKYDDNLTIVLSSGLTMSILEKLF